MRRWLLPVGAYVAVTIALTLPLWTHIRSAFPHDAGEPVLTSWALWWSTQRLPLTPAWWNAPMFYPIAGAMALSDLLIGLLPISATVQWLTHSPLAAYNVAFLVSFPLCALAAYLLALELTLRPDAALLAGFAFGFAPYRMGQLAHLQVLSYYWAPVALAGLHRYLRSRETKWLVLFAGAWLMQALSNGSSPFQFSVLITLWMVWFARPWRTAAPIVAAWLLASVPLVPILLKCRAVLTSLHLVANIEEIKRFGVDLGDVLSAPPDLALWGSRLWPARPETAIFPGVTVIAVGVCWLVSIRLRRGATSNERRTLDEKVLIGCSAASGVVALSAVLIGPWAVGPLAVADFRGAFSLAVLLRALAFLRGPWVRRMWRERSVAGFYVIAMLAIYLLALGPEPRLFGRPILYQAPYAWLMRLPGFDVLRVPARFVVLAVLCQSVLLALAVTRWSARAPLRAALFALIAAGLVADGWVRLPIALAPSPGPEWQDVAAVVEIPPGGRGDFAAIYRSMSSGFPIVNGYSADYPPHYLPLVYAIRDQQYSALQDVAAGRPLGVAIDRTSDDAAIAERMIGGMAGVARVPAAGDGWATFILRPTRPPAAVLPGSRIPIRSVRANRHEEDIGRLTDGKIETAWTSGLSQIGDEELIIDLGSTQPVGALVLGLGAFSFGFPRGLEIDASTDESTWMSAWAGRTAVLAVHAALTDPGRVPLTIDLGEVSGRFLRLRQTETEPGIPWWIAELDVRAPGVLAPR
jgi:hypothetical protein